MSDGLAGLAEQLAPVRAAMLRRARERADEITAAARRHAGELLAQARRDGEAEVARAGAEGRSQAAPLAVAERNRGRREARAIVLRVRREAYDDLQAQVRAAVCALREQPGYDQLRQRLAQTAAAQAGPGATVADDPLGGVVARREGTIVDCSLPRLADAAVAALGGDLAWLWTPGSGDTP